MFIRKITIKPETQPHDDYLLSLRITFGQENLDKAFLLYSLIHQNYSDPQEIVRIFYDELKKKGVPEMFIENCMLQSYCTSRFKTPIRVINNIMSYNHMISEITDVNDVKKMIRRIKHQKDRLQLSSLKLHDVEYEIHGEYMEKCLEDMILLLKHIEPECNPDDIVPRGVKAIIREYEVVE